MMEALRGIAGSKKFVAGIAGMIAAGLLRLGFDVATDDVLMILGPLMAAIVGQGVADVGKERAKIDG